MAGMIASGITTLRQGSPPTLGIFSTLIAGGGFRGGRVVGASDDRGMAVARRPIHPTDLVGAMYELLGIDGKAAFPNTEGITVLPDVKSGAKSGGRLEEVL